MPKLKNRPKLVIPEFKETAWLENTLKKRGMNLYIYSLSSLAGVDFTTKYVPAVDRQDADEKVLIACRKLSSFHGKWIWPKFLKDITV